MKQYVYQVKGVLTAEQVEVIKPLLPPTEGVASVDIQPSDGERLGSVTVEWSSEPSAEALAAWESSVDLLLRQNSDGELSCPALPERYVLQAPTKPRRRVPLSAAVGSVILSVILAILLTFSVTTSFMQKNTPTTGTSGTGVTDSRFEKLDALDRLFRLLSPLELDEQEMLDYVLKAYVASTGDRYAAYYTEEEFAAYQDTTAGKMVGIGINVVEDVISIGGMDYTAIVIINVYPDSPAEEAGVLPGDLIMSVMSDGTFVAVNEIGYEQASNLLVGASGTRAEFEVWRLKDGADASDASRYESVMISATRREIQTRSVQYRVCDTDESVGIIRITGFDDTTAEQFAQAVDALKAEGCRQFVFDLRYNPGGSLTSVVDVLTYFGRVSDRVISIKDKYGNEEVITVSDRVNAETGKLVTGSGTLEPADIGKYRNLTFTVLTNEYTASAAELFSAFMRDYELGTLVGVTTFGKGSIQTFRSLQVFGYDGYLKVTYGHYYPPCGEGYDGEGIEPDIVEPMSEEASAYKNFNLLPDDKDNQLQKAIEAMIGQS